MKINHTIAHYVIGVTALGLAGVATVQNHTAADTPPGIHASATPGRHDWNPLGEAKTEALGEALKALPDTHVRLYCASEHCAGLEKDLDDALQIAGWDSDFEDRQVDSEQDKGLFVGPPGKAAEAVAAAIHDATGITPSIVGISDIQGVGIIIGKTGAHQ